MTWPTILCAGSYEQDVVYGTPININMHAARKKKGIIDTLHFGNKRNESNRHLAINFNISRLFSHK